MKLKYIPINLKKIPYNLSLLLLTIGASLILGFLSFGGMYALLPVLPLAFATFVLSVAYEGEIYLQNIKGALSKLFKSNYLENTLAKEYLLNHFPGDTQDENCPQFFRDYKAQLMLLGAFGHQELDKESKKRKKQVEKTLSDMEKWFALQLFPNKEKESADESDYALQLRTWLANNHQQEYEELRNNQGFQYTIVKAFSILSGIFMGLGSTYLMVEAFTVIPFLAAIPFTMWPLMIVPLALIAGTAYGMLTFNAITDIINNDTVFKWYNKISTDLSKGLTLHNIFIASTAALLVGLAGALTVCTMGTWWTVATNARPLFDWMKNMPSFIMGVINPIITGLSAIFFNIQNSAESLEMVDEASQNNSNILKEVYDSIKKGYQHLIDTENWLQIINPFRLLLKLTITPLRVLLFIGHLISIAFTADRMPGVPQIVSMFIAMFSEGFEDAHYFIGGKNHEEHDHQDFKDLLQERLGEASGHEHGDNDIPTWLLQTAASPLYALAALWDYSFTNANISFKNAWDKQRGIAKAQHVELAPDAERPSKEWQQVHALARITKFENKHLKNVTVDRDLAEVKLIELGHLKEQIRNAQSSESLAETLKQAKNQPAYNQHRLFAAGKNEKTATQEFIETLPCRVNVN
ncbi:hypothetical protein [uncultured Legionella sp.]|uniref:hypothetical protein n=1 Tax=uncultured Legionella sp. TaxID=210934 RepID=UPI002620837E|nr:hypothetical protein [uncultured Legionella sp.]